MLKKVAKIFKEQKHIEVANEILLEMLCENLPQAFSSEPSSQSGFPSQNSSLSMHLPSPHAKSVPEQRGSSVINRGFTLRGPKS